MLHERSRRKPATPCHSPPETASRTPEARVRRPLKLKLIAAFSLLVLFALVTALSVTFHFFNAFLAAQFVAKVERTTGGIRGTLEKAAEEALSLAVLLAANPEVSRLAAAKDREGLLRFLGPIAKEAKLDLLTVTDASGTVLARTHKPEKFGDSIAGQHNIQGALKGTPAAGLEQGTEVLLSARAGAPLVAPSGTLLGAISTGFAISGSDRLAQEAAKQYGVVATVFLGDERVTTSLTQAGQSQSKTKLDPETARAVLQEGKTVTDQRMILGTPYLTSYGPLKGPDGKILGIVGAGQDRTEELRTRNRLLTLVVGLGVGVLAVCVVVGLWASQRIVTPLKQLVACFGRIAEGDLKVRAHIQATDELGVLGAGFDAMTEDLQHIVKRIKAAAEELAAAAQETAASGEEVTSTVNDIAEGNQELAKESKHGSAAAAEGAQVLLELSSLLQISQNLAHSATENSKVTLQTADNGRNMVSQTVVRMEDIRGITERTEALIQELGQYSERIGLISDTITGLADQTNLLALNAAIEAARAGEAGRGFAVVAEEVRKLAEQSHQGAGEVAELVGKVSASTSKAVAAMRESRAQVEEGNRVTHEAGESLEQILEAVRHTVEDIGRILVTTSDEVAKSDRIVSLINRTATTIEHVDANVENLAASTEQTSAAMENVASSAEEISAMADEMKTLVDRFQA